MRYNNVDMDDINREFKKLQNENDSLIQKCDQLNKELEVYKEAFKKMKDLELKRKIADFILNS